MDATEIEPIHNAPHPFAGKTVRLKTGEDYRLEDWWDRLGQGNWCIGRDNLACITYAIRGLKEKLPDDDEVVYGKIGVYGHLIHVSELDL